MNIKYLAAAGALLISTASCTSAPPVQSPSALDDFSREIDALRHKLHIPGMAAAVISDGEIVWSAAMGHSDIDDDMPVTMDTPFRLASVTKTIASTVVMMLVEQGMLDLDMRMSEFGVSFDNSADVTVRHVLSHTSEGQNPGERYKYNGNRFATLDSVIIATTGMSFAEAAKEMIIKRLPVENFSPSISDLSNALASPYQWSRKTGFALGAYPQHISPAAGFMASVKDLIQFDHAIDSGTFTTMQTYKVAWTPATNSRQKALPYGLGWFVETLNSEQVVWHYGYWECISSLYVKVPNRNLTFIALANSDGMSDGFNLASGRLRTSPVARLFLESFVY